MDEDMPFDFDIEDDARGVRALADKRRAAEREFMFIIIYISYCSMVRYQIIMVVGREVKNENADSSRQIANSNIFIWRLQSISYRQNGIIAKLSIPDPTPPSSTKEVLLNLRRGMRLLLLHSLIAGELMIGKRLLLL